IVAVEVGKTFVYRIGRIGKGRIDKAMLRLVAPTVREDAATGIVAFGLVEDETALVLGERRHPIARVGEEPRIMRVEDVMAVLVRHDERHLIERRAAEEALGHRLAALRIDADLE